MTTALSDIANQINALEVPTFQEPSFFDRLSRSIPLALATAADSRSGRNLAVPIVASQLGPSPEQEHERSLELVRARRDLLQSKLNAMLGIEQQELAKKSETRLQKREERQQKITDADFKALERKEQIFKMRKELSDEFLEKGDKANALLMLEEGPSAFMSKTGITLKDRIDIFSEESPAVLNFSAQPGIKKEDVKRFAIQRYKILHPEEFGLPPTTPELKEAQLRTLDLSVKKQIRGDINLAGLSKEALSREQQGTFLRELRQEFLKGNLLKNLSRTDIDKLATELIEDGLITKFNETQIVNTLQTGKLPPGKIQKFIKKAMIGPTIRSGTLTPFGIRRPFIERFGEPEKISATKQDMTAEAIISLIRDLEKTEQAGQPPTTAEQIEFFNQAFK